MGTRGLYTFIYKGKFYVFYNLWDSYPEELGESIVYEIKKMVKKDKLKKMKKLLDKVYKLYEEEGYHSDYELDKFKGLEEALYSPYSHGIEILDKKPKFDDKKYDFVEWMYFINMDKQHFSVSNGDILLTYPFNNIPSNWYSPFYDESEYDDSGSKDIEEETENNDEDTDDDNGSDNDDSNNPSDNDTNASDSDTDW